MSALTLLWILHHCSISNKEQAKNIFISDKAASLLADKILLEEIRQGNSSNAIMLLEMDVDSGMTILSNELTSVNLATKTNVNYALEALKEYETNIPKQEQTLELKGKHNRIASFWPNRDPIGEVGEINLYQFVYNDPCDGVGSSWFSGQFNFG